MDPPEADEPRCVRESRASIDRFVDALWIEDGLARLTLEAYRRDLNLYAQWLGAEGGGRTLDASTEVDLLGYIAARHAESRATTANRRLTVFKRYFRWAVRERLVPVESLFRRDGVSHLTLEPGELLTAIEIPRPRPRLQTAYQKLRMRQAIDFPALSLAVAASFEADERVAHLAVVGTALMATPRRVSGLDKLAVGQRLTPEVIEAIGQRAYQQLVPLTNILVDPEWRREMVPVLVDKALARAVAGAA